MINWAQKLSSRKWWASLCDFVSMFMYALRFSETTVERIVSLIMAGGGLIAYTIAEGWIDAKRQQVQLIEMEPQVTEEPEEDEEAA